MPPHDMAMPRILTDALEKAGEFFKGFGVKLLAFEVIDRVLDHLFISFDRVVGRKHFVADGGSGRARGAFVAIEQHPA